MRAPRTAVVEQNVRSPPPTPYSSVALLLGVGLKERRERKRAKRAVVEAEISDKENDKNESGPTRTRNKKLPAGFALMHGFSATNVGKERLTVNDSSECATDIHGIYGR